MQHDSFLIRIDGQELPDLYPDLLSLVVELDDELAGLCRIRLLLTPSGEGWRYLDDARIAAWKSVEVEGGVEDDITLLFSGSLVQIRPMFGRDVDGAVLELVAMDASALMDRVDVLKTWPNKKDSDIATELFMAYGLIPEVDATEVVHDEALSTVLQRETDIKFLKRLALRNGYECFIHGSNGYFRLPVVDPEPKPVLAVHFGSDTTIRNVVVDIDAMMPTDVAVYQLSRPDKSVLSVLQSASEQAAFGANDSTSLLAPGMSAGNRVVGLNGALDATEMQALVRGLRDRETWFVSVSGDVDGNAYGHVLLPRDNVWMKGIGETYSGRYYVSRVVHSFAAGGYIQSVQLRRNALQLAGDEVFEADAGLLGAFG